MAIELDKSSPAFLLALVCPLKIHLKISARDLQDFADYRHRRSIAINVQKIVR